MKPCVFSFPRGAFVDATYKLNDVRMPVYLMMCVDGNGQSEIVFLFLTSLETEDAITTLNIVRY